MSELKKPKIYISGAITNNPEYKVQFTRKYRELEKDYRVLTPLFINVKLDWSEYMSIDLAMIDVCDCIYMMKGWRTSKGAVEEYRYAQEKGLKIIEEK